MFFKENFDKNPWQPRRNTNIKKYYFFTPRQLRIYDRFDQKTSKKSLFEKKCAKKVILPGCIDLKVPKVAIFGDPGKSGKWKNPSICVTHPGVLHIMIFFTCGIWIVSQVDPDFGAGVRETCQITSPVNLTMDFKNWENFRNNSTMDLRIGEIWKIIQRARFFWKIF